ncbi:MAG: nuclease-related domain-containing protein [Geminicoccaceae bacterium]
MEIYRGGELPQTVVDWAGPAARALAGLQLPAPRLADLDPFLFFLGLALALAAWRAQRSWLRGLLGEWRVARLLRRHGLAARHDVLLPHPDGTGWTQIDHLVRLPDRILVIETKNLAGRLTGGARDARWTQRFGRSTFSIQNPLHQNALHLRAVRRVVGRDIRLQGLVLLVGRAWVEERLPMGCFRLDGFTRLLREAGRRDRFGPIGHRCLDPAWDRLATASSTRLRDRWQHAAMVDLMTGAKPRVTGAGLALAAGAALGFALAG